MIQARVYSVCRTVLSLVTFKVVMNVTLVSTHSQMVYLSDLLRRYKNEETGWRRYTALCSYFSPRPYLTHLMLDPPRRAEPKAMTMAWSASDWALARLDWARCIWTGR